METKTVNIQPVMAESWFKSDQRSSESRSIQPVPKGEKSTGKKVGEGNRDAETSRSLSGKVTEEIEGLAQEVQDYFSELNISLDFHLDDKTKEMVVRVVDRETGEIIRQLPPDDLLQLREKLVELRGVLFDGKI